MGVRPARPSTASARRSRSLRATGSVTMSGSSMVRLPTVRLRPEGGGPREVRTAIACCRSLPAGTRSRDGVRSRAPGGRSAGREIGVRRGAVSGGRSASGGTAAVRSGGSGDVCAGSAAVRSGGIGVRAGLSVARCGVRRGGSSAVRSGGVAGVRCGWSASGARCVGVGASTSAVASKVAAAPAKAPSGTIAARSRARVGGTAPCSSADTVIGGAVSAPGSAWVRSSGPDT